MVTDFSDKNEIIFQRGGWRPVFGGGSVVRRIWTIPVDIRLPGGQRVQKHVQRLHQPLHVQRPCVELPAEIDATTVGIDRERRAGRALEEVVRLQKTAVELRRILRRRYSDRRQQDHGLRRIHTLDDDPHVVEFEKTSLFVIDFDLAANAHLLGKTFDQFTEIHKTISFSQF